MASIARDKNGYRRILFVAADGRRPTIRLGKVSQRAAEAVKFRVEQLLAAKLTGHALEADTASWIAELDPVMSGKLGRVGLIPKSEAKSAIALGEHLANYFAKRTDVKGSTLTNWRHTERSLVAFFGAGRALETITPGDAKDWERWLKTGEARENRYAVREAETGLSPNTVRKRASNAKQFFQDAVQRGLLAKNPFVDLKGAVGNNRDRDHFISRDDAAKVLEACPDSQWRLLFALSRYGGLRCPSEHLALKWVDVNWADGRFLVRSAKTAHHDGKGTRWVPLFPELRPFLEQAWDEALPGTEYVITRNRDGNANLRTQLERIIERAGLKPWPKLFQNLRASRATELANEFPAHVAAAWLGHSTVVASKHYWQVTDDDFARAAGGSAPAAQKAAQQAHAGSCNESQPARSEHKKTPEMPGFAASCEITQNGGVGDTGLEPVTPSLSSYQTILAEINSKLYCVVSYIRSMVFASHDISCHKLAIDGGNSSEKW